MKNWKRKANNVKTRYPKCPSTHKSCLPTEQDARRVMMRIWSHDPKADIKDLHVYLCDVCGKWHVGHISYYQMMLQKSEKISQPESA